VPVVELIDDGVVEAKVTPLAAAIVISTSLSVASSATVKVTLDPSIKFNLGLDPTANPVFFLIATFCGLVNSDTQAAAVPVD
jgi:hypothetical protein